MTGRLRCQWGTRGLSIVAKVKIMKEMEGPYILNGFESWVLNVREKTRAQVPRKFLRTEGMTVMKGIRN